MTSESQIEQSTHISVELVENLVMNDNLETDVPSDSKTEELPKQTHTPAFNQLGINDNISSGQGAEVSNAQAMSMQDMLTALFEKFTIKEQEREKQREFKEQERERQRQQEKEKRRQEKPIEKQQQELRDQEKEKKFMENINNIFLERDKEIVRKINQVLVDRDNAITTHFKQEIEAVKTIIEPLTNIPVQVNSLQTEVDRLENQFKALATAVETMQEDIPSEIRKLVRTEVARELSSKNQNFENLTVCSNDNTGTDRQKIADNLTANINAPQGRPNFGNQPILPEQYVTPRNNNSGIECLRQVTEANNEGNTSREQKINMIWYQNGNRIEDELYQEPAVSDKSQRENIQASVTGAVNGVTTTILLDTGANETQDLLQRDFQPAADPNHDAADGSRRHTDSAGGGPAAATTCLRSNGSTRGRYYDVSGEFLRHSIND
ncbi:probable E3 ubiquitin-protein ligase bre1 [Schistocerca americana]|uniref:probable E3 ubiquitin-protein ligase bre1 n=1 Tax=Schistocerca americana TaxID=7009 RepID=UPI001F4FA2BC|nr:probable E3 ubiquitin-protein ligase bre1 [Schistocerca americana]